MARNFEELRELQTPERRERNRAATEEMVAEIVAATPREPVTLLDILERQLDAVEHAALVARETMRAIRDIGRAHSAAPVAAPDPPAPKRRPTFGSTEA